MFPALDYGYFASTTLLPVEYVDQVRITRPGFLEQRVLRWTERLYSQLSKRYGQGTTANNIPFGNTPPTFTSQGTTPPQITLSGVPTLGSLRLQVQVLSGTTFQWSLDGGVNWTGPLTIATTVLGTTGLTLTFGAGTYSTDNFYIAPTPVPTAILGWIVDLLNLDILRARGFNPNDPQPQLLIEDAKRALEEVAQAANSKDGLFNLPVVDEGADATCVGGPLWYTEQSPYVGADQQERAGIPEDFCGQGTFGGT